jgi:hypothetical protein
MLINHHKRNIKIYSDLSQLRLVIMENLEQPSELPPVDPGVIDIKEPVMSEVEQHRLDNPVAVEVMEEIQKLRGLHIIHLPGLLQKVDAILTRVDNIEIAFIRTSHNFAIDSEYIMGKLYLFRNFRQSVIQLVRRFTGRLTVRILFQ